MKNIFLKRATLKNLEELLDIEKSVGNLKTYSALTDEKEMRQYLKNDVFYLIKKNEKTVGNVSYEIKSKNHAYLSGLAVYPSFQKKGIGREVLNQILKKLKSFKRIDLATHPQNSNAIKLYLDLGFYIESWKDNYFGDGEPRIIFTKIKHKSIKKSP